MTQTTSPIKIRPITPEDFRAFHTCLDAVSRERKYLGLVEAPPLASTLEWLQKSQDRADIHLVALDGPRMVGWSDVEIKTQEGFTHRGRLGMGVLEEYRGRGIATELLVKTLEIAQGRNLERIELDVYATNLPAIRLYQKFNFQIEGRKIRARKIDGRYDDIILMALIYGP